jgi:hypothetical protein
VRVDGDGDAGQAVVQHRPLADWPDEFLCPSEQGFDLLPGHALECEQVP